MGKLTDLLAALAEMDEKPDTQYDDILAAHEFDIGEANSALDALAQSQIDANANSENAIAQLTGEINTLKSRNYDLVRSLPASDNAGGGTNDDDDVLGDTDSDVLESPEQTTIDSLFTEKE